jgi:hypothetical protein
MPFNFSTRVACAVAVLVILPGKTISAGELSEEERKSGFVSMFNGKDFGPVSSVSDSKKNDFDGWRFTAKSKAPPKNWTVSGGVIKLSGGGSPHLATVEQFANFEMRFEWRALREKYNSGFFIRSPEKLGKNQLNLAKGSEGRFIGGKLDGAKSAGDLQKKSGEWNEWRVLVIKDTVVFHCNGKLAWKGTGLKPDQGFIGLQAEGAPLEFRNLRIREINE